MNSVDIKKARRKIFLLSFMVEPEGFEPSSQIILDTTSTCLVCIVRLRQEQT